MDMKPAVIGAIAAGQKPLTAFLGAAAGCTLAAGFAIILGQLAEQLIPDKLSRVVGGAAFIGAGLLVLFKGPD